MTQDPDDNSAALRASAEDDNVRAVIERVLSTREATDKFSAWLLVPGHHDYDRFKRRPGRRRVAS